MKASAVAPANIAFIKYWGKKDKVTRLPLNSSISMNIDAAHTTTTIEFSDNNSQDQIELIGGQFSDGEIKRIEAHLDRVRRIAKISHHARVLTQNSFPKSAGMASSASGYAALTIAASEALKLSLSEKELSILARLGSGSACRSIPDGYVYWVKGEDSSSSYAYSLHSPDYWDLRDIICIVEESSKKVSSSEGMDAIHSSPFADVRLKYVNQALKSCVQALAEKDISTLGEIIEKDALNMHAVMMTQTPAILYWNEQTIRLIGLVRQWRSEGLAVYFTIDAGPNIHLICQSADEQSLLQKLRPIAGIRDVLVGRPSSGTKVTQKHLF